MKKRPLILIDPGHGGTDPGAVAAGHTEASINLRVAQQLGPMLFSERFDVHYTRYFDQSVSLATRVQISDDIRPDLFLSLHCNSASSPGANGIEVFTSPGQTESDFAATCLIDSLKFSFPDSVFRTDFSDDDPDKEAHFYVLTETDCAAALVEMGFLSNDEERAWLLQESTPLMISLALTSGLLAWKETL
ncbi:N-acetylmuramoyl-L-alanine amidase [uncultured Desulfuromusa sp.]|uniref:N-acetylmuramoyl-L-alanine amidase family protein n=1 Tax=uncultured Desulfuromusa sp. TaxID=219183 RepID=UPI002AA6456F|nr:N-acetylmuramoyl-L-alanine amidase [uncultured Desulfuromusa sp.]